MAFAQVGIVGFDGQIELEALRLFGLPEAAPAVLYVCPSVPVGTREFQAEVSWDMPSLASGATSLTDVTVTRLPHGPASSTLAAGSRPRCSRVARHRRDGVRGSRHNSLSGAGTAAVFLTIGALPASGSPASPYCRWGRWCSASDNWSWAESRAQAARRPRQASAPAPSIACTISATVQKAGYSQPPPLEV